MEKKVEYVRPTSVGDPYAYRRRVRNRRRYAKAQRAAAIPTKMLEASLVLLGISIAMALLVGMVPA